MPWYTPVPAAADLRGALVCAWTADVAGTHVLVPDGCIDVLWLAGVGIRVCGPETSAWTFTRPPGTAAVGVRFRPGAAPALLGARARDIRDTRIDLADVCAARENRLLRDRLDHATSAEDRIMLLQNAVRGWCARATIVDELAPRLGAALEERSWTVAALADAAAMTERHLQRRCQDAFGYSPATLRSILRLQRFMRLARAAPQRGLAELAVAAGYADQAHLSRECRRIGSRTPTELLASQAPDWHGGAPLFVTSERAAA